MQRNFSRSNGLTILELIAAIGIIGVLVAIVFPSYQQFRMDTYRADTQKVMYEMIQKQEEFFSQYFAYTRHLSNLAEYSTNTVAAGDGKFTITAFNCGNTVTSTVVIPGGGVDCVRLTANATTATSNCATFSINSNLVKTPAECW